MTKGRQVIFLSFIFLSFAVPFVPSRYINCCKTSPSRRYWGRLL
jgi:hypothetical protein